MDSLYGGKPGISFVLKASYKSVNEMINAFKGGGNYTAVWYGEYVIIDTTNKQNVDNGKIYRRGLDYQNNMGGAEYIGQIVGPSSGTPYFEIDDLETVKGYAGDAVDNETSWKRYPTGRQSNGRYAISNNGNGRDIATFDFNTKNALVPGKEDGNVWHDSIKYTWVNIRNDEEDADSWFYVGFEIPYTVIDFAIHTTSPYNSLGNRVDLSEIQRVDDKSHPFWEKWDIGIPKGVKGDTFRNLRIIHPTADDNIYFWNEISTTIDSNGTYKTTYPTTGGYRASVQGREDIEIPNEDNTISHTRAILVFDFWVYDDTRDGKYITVYVADYDVIEEIKLDDDGTLRLNMSHHDQYHYDKKIRWVDYIDLTNGDGAAGGHFTFTWNNDDPRATDEFDISWIKALEVEEDGSLVYTYAGRDDLINQHLPEGAVQLRQGQQLVPGRYRVSNFIQWLKSIDLDTDNGHFTVTNNRNETIFTADLDWIKDISLSENGVVSLWHTTTGEEQLDQKIKWVNAVTLNSLTGFFEMQFNYGAPLQVQMDWIDNVYIDESNGDIGIHHVNDSQNTDLVDNNKAQKLEAKLKLITQASISSDGKLTFRTNTGEEIPVTNANNPDQELQIKYLENIRLAKRSDYNASISGAGPTQFVNADKHIQVKYNTENIYQNIGDPINYIQDIVVRPSDWHLLVLFSDPEHRHDDERDGDLREDGTDANGIIWVNGVAGSRGEYYNDTVYWRDYGTIKDQAGILIGWNLTEEQLKEEEAWDGDILRYLEATHPDGLTGEDNRTGGISTRGKIVTYRPKDSEDVEFYAFDYWHRTWYFLGKIADSGMRDARLFNETLNKGSSAKNEVIAGLNTDGLMFSSYDMTASKTSIPEYWTHEYKE